jgi:hypothetical protein
LGYKNYDRKPAVRGEKPFLSFFSVGGGLLNYSKRKRFIFFTDYFLLFFISIGEPLR